MNGMKCSGKFAGVSVSAKELIIKIIIEGWFIVRKSVNSIQNSFGRNRRNYINVKLFKRLRS